ncbi:hypothetical protein [Kiloniella laminariae]|uniref:hypothetical protein n=1 Tax=Kiloniella laminariae TaxID=454162 RepID=UPI0003827E3D|nr:hypothetical protein [Kiloniella laminariae]
MKYNPREDFTADPAVGLSPIWTGHKRPDNLTPERLAPKSPAPKSPAPKSPAKAAAAADLASPAKGQQDNAVFLQLTDNELTAKKDAFSAPDRLELTPAPFAVFSALVTALAAQSHLPPDQRALDYNRLKSLSGMDATRSFPKHIQELVAKGVILCLGPHRERIVTLRMDPSRVLAVKRYARQTSQHSKPQVSSSVKIRKCLNCRKEFESHWAGERVCSPCKEGPDWGEHDSPFTPIGDSDGAGLSDLMTGLI